MTKCGKHRAEVGPIAVSGMPAHMVTKMCRRYYTYTFQKNIYTDIEQPKKI